MYPLVFIAVALVELASISMIFISRDVLHSVLALSAAFFFNSLLFLLLSQPLLALLQLFIMVGGISTYLFVGVAAVSYSRFKHTTYSALMILSVAFFTLLLYNSLGVGFPAQQQNPLSSAAISNYLSSGVGQLYIITFALFGIALGSILLLKRIGSI